MWPIIDKILGKLSLTFNSKKGNENKTIIKDQVFKDSQQSNAHFDNVENIHINQANARTEQKMLEIMGKVVDQNIAMYQDMAKTKALQRNDEFKQLIEAQVNNLSTVEMTKLAEPDTQGIILEASNINVRTSNFDLRKILASLVIKRVKDDKKGQEELKNIVYNEAIHAVGKITNNQLKIITVSYLLTQTMDNSITSLEKLNEYFNKDIKPLLDFRNTNSEFNYLVYAGLASIMQVGHIDIIEIFKQQYTFLFLKPMTLEEIENLGISKGIANEILTAINSGITIKNADALQEALDKIKIINPDTKSKLVNFYKSRILENIEIEKLIFEKTDAGKELIKSYNESKLRQMSLTPVGLAIAIANFEQISGMSLDVDLWIN